jgi:hypothetical protein
MVKKREITVFLDAERGCLDPLIHSDLLNKISPQRSRELTTRT